MTTLTQPTAVYDGYDSFLGVSRDGAVSGSSGTTQGETSNYVYVCTDSESVSSALSVSASISGSGIDYSASAKATFSEQLNVTSTSVVVIVHTIVQSGVTSASPGYDATTSPGIRAEDQQAFFTQYGDSFVDVIVTGGEYYAAFVYNSTTSSQQEAITASLKGSVGESGVGTVSASLSTALDTAASDNDATYTISQNMFGATGVSLPTDSAGIVTFSGNFDEYVNVPEILGYHVTGYERGGVSNFTAIVNNRNLFGTDTTPATVASTISALASAANTINAMYSGYHYTSDSGFTTKCTQINADLSTINTLINDIESDVTAAYTAPSLLSLTYGTPVASYQVKPAMGTLSTGEFYDLSASQIASGVTPSQIVLTAGGFKVTYSDGTVISHNAVGNVVGTLSIASDDHIAKIETTNHSNITYVVTAKGVSAGTDNPTAFPTSAPPAIIGFAGSAASSGASASYGAIQITISPAVWGTSSS